MSHARTWGSDEGAHTLELMAEFKMEVNFHQDGNQFPHPAGNTHDRI